MPYTSFRYAQGNQQYISLEALHTQQIIPTWSFAAGITSFTTKGYGVGQLHEHRAPFVNSLFYTPNNRWQIVASLKWLKKAGATSGGIFNGDSVRLTNGTKLGAADYYFISEPGRDRNNLPVGLDNSFDSGYLRQHAFRVQYHLGNKYLDTTDSIRKVLPIFSLHYQLDMEKERWLYNGSLSDTNYINRSGFNYNSTLRDSVFFRKISQEFGIKKLQKDINGIGLGGALGLELGDFTQSNFFTFSTINSFMNAEVKTTIFNNISFNGNGKLYLSGYNGGDYFLNGSGALKYKNKLVLAEVESQLYEPGMQQILFFTTSYGFANLNFNKTLSNKISIAYKGISNQKPWKLQFLVKNINNYILFDQSLRPQQLSSAIQLIQLNMDRYFNYKNWNAHTMIFAQQTNGSALIDLPNFGGRLDVFYMKNVFDSNLNIKTGLDFSYYSRHTPLGFQPILRQFYFDNTNQAVGNYPLLDLYFCGQIKSAIFFIKGENLLNLVLNETDFPSFSTPLYIASPTALRVGFLWDFYF